MLGVVAYSNNTFALTLLRVKSPVFVSRTHAIKPDPIFVFRKNRTQVLTTHANLQIQKNTQLILAKAMNNGSFAFVLAKLNELNLPPELALVPLIESSYELEAISIKGAGGLWQLMPATAAKLGIKSADRFKLLPSTQAGLVHLRALYKTFGSWELALAAYHAGGRRVQLALAKNPFAKAEELALPKETKHYVAQFMALKNLLKEQFTIRKNHSWPT